MSSPTQRTLAYYRGQGLDAVVVEYWSHFAKKRMDVCGCDVLVFGPKIGVALVQTTSNSNRAARERKLEKNGQAIRFCHVGRILTNGWRKSAKTNKWVVTENEMMVSDDGVWWQVVE